MADTIYIESRSREVIEPRTRILDVIEVNNSYGGALWGRIVGDIKKQADLMAKLNKIEKLAKAGIVL